MSGLSVSRAVRMPRSRRPIRGRNGVLRRAVGSRPLASSVTIRCTGSHRGGAVAQKAARGPRERRLRSSTPGWGVMAGTGRDGECDTGCGEPRRHRRARRGGLAALLPTVRNVPVVPVVPVVVVVLVLVVVVLVLVVVVLVL